MATKVCSRFSFPALAGKYWVKNYYWQISHNTSAKINKTSFGTLQNTCQFLVVPRAKVRKNHENWIIIWINLKILLDDLVFTSWQFQFKTLENLTNFLVKLLRILSLLKLENICKWILLSKSLNSHHLTAISTHI
jgi:hypothetical protein